MRKRWISFVLAAVMLFGLPVAYAQEEQTENQLYCLSDNTWQAEDTARYQEMGIALSNYETGATYQWEEGSDGQVMEQDSECRKMTGGFLDGNSGEYAAWSTWGETKNTATAVFDLQNTYWVSRVDAWSLAKKQSQAGVVEVRIGESLDQLRAVPAAKTVNPSDSEIDAAGGKAAALATTEWNAAKARYVLVTYHVSDQQSNVLSENIFSMIAAEIVIFGYLEKPISADEEIGEIEETEPAVIHSSDAPKLDERNCYLTDLGAVYEVTGAEVTQYCSSVSGMDGYEIYLSSDEKNYMSVANAEVSDNSEYTKNTTVCNIQGKMYARYVKLVFRKSEKKQEITLTNLKIMGRDGISQQRIDQNADYSYYTKQPYQTADDIRFQDADCKKLMDGNTEETVSTSEKWANVVVDLKEPYQIGDVDVYTLSDGNYFTEGAEIRYSLDGEKWFSYSYYVNQNPQNQGGIVKSSFSGIPGRNARYLKIILQSAEHQIAVSEIAVSGYPVKMARAKTPPRVPLRVEMKNYLLAYLDWSTYNCDNASKMALYIEQSPYTSTKGLTPVAVYERFDDEFINRYATKTGLEPERTYYFAITPFDDEGNEYQSVTPVKVTTQGVLGTKVRDVFNLTNHPNYTGGATVRFGSYTDQMKAEAVRLYDELGASNKTRSFDLGNVQDYTNIGVSTMMINDGTTSKNYGNWMHSNGNEMDLHKADTDAFLRDMKASYKKLKNDDPRHVLIDPVLGGTEVSSLNWLDELYRAGNGIETKMNFDALDAHFYCKSVDEQIPGLASGVPEILFKKIQSVRNVMKKYHDEDKPIVCTEIGFITSDKPGYQPALDYETQSDYVVRAYHIMISQGISEVWYYNFHDDGPDINYTEHNYGLIDYFGTAKPAYYGYYNMYQQLRNTEFLGQLSGVSNPYYGCEYYDEQKNKHISVIWNAAGQDKTMRFETVSGKDEGIEVISSDGGFSYLETENGEASVTIGSTPVYLYSDAGIKVNSINVAFDAVNASKDTTRNRDVTFTVSRQALGAGLSGYVEADGMPAGWTIQNDTHFDSTQNQFDVVIHVPESAEEQTEKFVLNVVTENGIVTPIQVSVNVKISVSIHFVPQPVDKENWNQWRIAAYCTNIVDVPVDATLSVLGSSGITLSSEMQKLQSLQPGDTKVVYFDVSELPKAVGAAATFSLEINGKRTNIDRALNFSACVNDGVTPQLDGVLSPGEWDGCQVITDTTNTDSLKSANMTAADCSWKLYRKWDEENLYIAVDVTDDVFYQAWTGGDMWQGDNLQIALDQTRTEGVGCATTDYFELGISRNPETEELDTWAWLADILVKRDVTVQGCVGKTSRSEDGHTVYEIKIPWAYLYEKPQIEEYSMIGFSFVVNDNDGKGRKLGGSYMNGIADASKNPNSFEDMVLVRK